MATLSSNQDDADQELSALMSNVQLGCRTSFARLYELTSHRMFGLVLRISKERALAEDVLQEAYVKVWNESSGFDAQRGQVMSWLAAVCRHGAIDQLRRDNARPTAQTMRASDVDLDPYAEIRSPAPGPEEDCIASRRAHAVQEVLSRLPHGPNESLRLAFFEGLSHAEIATRMDLPLGTVKTWIRRSLLGLRPAMLGHR